MALLCHCFRISDRVVRAEAQRGAQCPADLAATCGAGSKCGGCVEALHAVLAACRSAPTVSAA